MTVIITYRGTYYRVEVFTRSGQSLFVSGTSTAEEARALRVRIYQAWHNTR